MRGIASAGCFQHKDRDGPAKQLVARVAEPLFDATVDEHDAACFVDKHFARGRRLDDLSEPQIRGSTFLIGSLRVDQRLAENLDLSNARWFDWKDRLVG